MTIYYTLTFMLLAGEMATFCVLVAPLPQKARRFLFSFLMENPIVAKLAYALKISFIFVAILFFDAVQRMFRVTAESDLAKSGQQGFSDVRTETNLAARKFYAQRNTYLTGFCLFLSLVLTRTFYIMLDLLHAQDENIKLKNERSQEAKENQMLYENAAARELQIRELQKKIKELEFRERDFEILKSQAAAQAREYNRLADMYNEATTRKSNKKTD